MRAILFTVALAVVTNAFSSALVQRAIGLVFGISAVGEALSPSAGGFFTESLVGGGCCGSTCLSAPRSSSSS